MQLRKRQKRKKWRKNQNRILPPTTSCMPSLSTYSRFDVLAIEQSNETIETVETAAQILESLPPSIPLLPQYPASCPKWEKPLPSKFIIAVTEGNPTSLKLKIELETTNTAEVKSANALVDCGATSKPIP